MNWYKSKKGSGNYHLFDCDNGVYDMVKSCSGLWTLGFWDALSNKGSLIGQYKQKWQAMDAAKSHFMGIESCQN